MSRYIDADALIESVCHTADLGGWIGDTLRNIKRLAVRYINSAPSIDIVRCKECRYCKKRRGTFKGEPIIFYRCTENNRDVEADDFCSYGERSE